MVEKCANPSCNRSFRYFGRGGRLFAFEVRHPESPCKDVSPAICEKHPSHATVCFWLCEQCARQYVVDFTVATGMHMIARPAKALSGTGYPRNATPPDPASLRQDWGGYDPDAVRCSDDEVLAGVPL